MDDDAKDNGKTPIIVGLVVGGAMVTLGPLAGFFGTLLGLKHSFAAVGEVRAENKATMLSAGIAEAMSATSLGMYVAGVGVVIVAICGFLLWRRSQRR